MNELAGFIAMYIAPFELMLASIMYLILLKRREHFYWRLSGGIAGYFVMVILLSQGLPCLGIYIRFMQMCVINMVYVIGVILFCCQVSLSESIHFVAFSHATQHCAYCLHRLIFAIEDPTQLSRYGAGYFIVYAGVYVAFYYAFAKRIVLVTDGNSKKPLSLTYSILTIFITLMLSYQAQRFEQESMALYRISMVYAVFCCIALLYSQLYQYAGLKLRHELDLKELLWAEKSAQYELSRENIAIINQKCHDLKYQIEALHSMQDSTDKDQMLQEIERSVEIYDSIVKTGNHAVDTVLTEKSLKCQRNNIVLTCIADGECLSFIEPVDVYTIFGNALDNAIECVCKLESVEKRVIAISIFERAGLIFIQIENYYDTPLVLNRDGMPVTTKERNGYHGFGVNGIRQAVERYGGFLTIKGDNSIFLLRITIPLEQH